jgi:hypothetical protein
VTPVEWRKELHRLMRERARAKAAARRSPSLALALNYQATAKKLDEHIRQHKLNYYELTEGS